MKYTIIILLILSNCACSQKDSFKSYLLSKFAQEKEQGVIDLRNFKDPDWDKLYIIGYYANEDNFDSTLLPYRAQILNTGIDMADTFVLVLLFKENRLVRMSKFTNAEIPLYSLVKIDQSGKYIYYRKFDAIFKFKRFIDKQSGLNDISLELAK